MSQALQDTWTPGSTPGAGGKCYAPPKSLLEHTLKICELPYEAKFLKVGLKKIRRLRKKAQMFTVFDCSVLVSWWHSQCFVFSFSAPHTQRYWVTL